MVLSRDWVDAALWDRGDHRPGLSLETVSLHRPTGQGGEGEGEEEGGERCMCMMEYRIVFENACLYHLRLKVSCKRKIEQLATSANLPAISAYSSVKFLTT